MYFDQKPMLAPTKVALNMDFIYRHENRALRKLRPDPLTMPMPLA
jgi:hypothetical protein